MKPVGNYSNINFPKTIDNLRKLSLNGIRFQETDYKDKEGQALIQIDGASGELSLGFPRIGNNLIYEVSPDFPYENSRQFNTFQNAISQITADADEQKIQPVLIAYQGSYSEPQLKLPRDLTIFSYLKNWGPGVTLTLNEDLTLNVTNEAFILMNTGTNIKGLDIRGNQLCNKLIQRDEDEQKGGPSFLFDTIMSGSPVCLYINNSDFAVNNCRFRDSGNQPITDVGIDIASGSLTLTGGDMTSRTNPPVMDGIRINVPDPPLAGPIPTIQVNGTKFENLDNCIDYRNGNSQFTGCIFRENQLVLEGRNATFQIDATKISLNNSVLEGNTDDIEINEFINLAISGSILDGTKLTADPYIRDNIAISYIESNIDKSKGLHVEGNLILGSQRRPTFFWTAQGSGSPEATTFIKYDPTNGYVDVTSTLKPSGTGTITLFDDLTNGEFYFACGTKFYTIIATITQTLIPNTGLDAQYWDGSSWVNVNYMSSQGVRPYGSYSNSLFSTTATEEVRFDIRLDGSAFNWQTTIINGVEKFFIRLVPNITLTQSPILDVLKIIYSTTRTDDEGIPTSFGTARVYKSLTFDLNLIKSPGSASTRPADQDLYLGGNSRLGRTQNRMGSGDIIGGSFYAPIDMDTSSPIKLIIAFCSSATTGTQLDFSLTLTTGSVENGDLIYFTQASATGNPIRNQQQQTILLTPNQTNGRYLVIQEILVNVDFITTRNTNSSIVDLYSFDMERNVDSNANDLVLVNIAFTYFSFTSGAPFT